MIKQPFLFPTSNKLVEMDFAEIEARLMLWAYEIEKSINEAFANVMEGGDEEYIALIKNAPPDEVAVDLLAFEYMVSCLSPIPTIEDLVPFIIKWRKEHG